MKFSIAAARIDSLMRFFIYLLLFWLPYSSAVVESSVVTATLLWFFKRTLCYWQQRPQAIFWKTEPIRFLKAFKPSQSILNRPIGVFIFFCLLTTVGSAFGEISWHGLITKTLEWFVVYFLILEVFTEKKYILKALGIFIFSGFSAALYSLGQFYLAQKDIWIYGKIGGDGRAAALFHTGNELGGYLTLLVLLSFSLLFLRGLKEKWYALSTLIFCVFGWSLMATFSRGAWISVFLALFLYLFFINRRTVLILAAFMILLGALYFVVPADVKKDSRFDVNSIDASASWRLGVWQDTMLMIADRPLFGHGINTYMRLFQEYRRKFKGQFDYNPTYAHNCYVQMAAEVGILGLLGFLGILICLFQKSLKIVTQMGPNAWNTKVLIMGLLSGILAFLLHACFDTHFYSIKLVVAFWAVVGFLVSFQKLLNE